MSNIDLYGSGQEFYNVGIAAPSTRLGDPHIVGIEMFADESKPRTIYHSRDDKRLNVGYLTHDTLKAHSQFSSAEKMEILQGRNSGYESLFPAFQEVARQEGFCLPVARNNLALSFRWLFQPSIYRRATYTNGDSATLNISRADSHHLYYQLRMDLPSLSSSIWIQMNHKTKTFAILRGTTSEQRFLSPNQLDKCLDATLAFLLEMDPVWSAWMFEHFTEPFSADHPLLKAHDVPPRHQGYIAMVLGAAYAKAKKDAKQLEALRAKRAAAVSVVRFFGSSGSVI